MAPYIRDVYLSYLIRGARRTKKGYPIIEKWMVATEIPKSIVQWDCRSKCKDKKSSAISFYCNDQFFQPVINNPKKYETILGEYQSIIGMDASPFDNMPPVVQESQIFVNLAVTYYYGRRGYKIIPNVRLGCELTYDSLEAYPKGTMIAIGTNGFIKDKKNRFIFINQIKLIVDTLFPTVILVYGKADDDLFSYARERGVEIVQYDSYIMTRRSK